MVRPEGAGHGKELTKRFLFTSSLVLARCGLNLPKEKINCGANGVSDSDTHANAVCITLNPTILKPIRSNDPTLVLWGVRANHQHPRSQHHAEIAAQFFRYYR